MNETMQYIRRTVYEIAVELNGKMRWLKYRHGIRKRLEQLKPDIPDDDSVNRIAFNVGNDKPRMKIKTGRFLTKKLQLNSGYLNDQTIQIIASKINMHLFASDINAKLISGYEITEAYKNGIGASSCMTGSCCEYTRLYESNQTRFQMLVMHYADNSARAIVHKLDNGDYLLDRVYSDDDELKEKMRDYAKEHNWYYRNGSYICFGDTGIENYDDMIVSGLHYDDGEIPYMDTLAEYRICDGKMDIFHRKSNYSCDGTLDNTCGTLEDCNTCENCGETMHDDETMCAGGMVLCRDCYGENYSYCEICSEDYHNDEMVYIKNKQIYVCSNCANSHYTKCEDCGDYFKDITCTANDDYLCEPCLLNSHTRCEGCSEWFANDDIDADGLCEDCKSEDADIPEQNENDTAKLPFEESVRNAE